MTATDKRVNRIMQGMYIKYHNYNNEMELVKCEKIGIKEVNEIMDVVDAETEGQVVYIEQINDSGSITLFVRDEHNENYEYQIWSASKEYYELQQVIEGDVA